jgi:hypothetical protein
MTARQGVYLDSCVLLSLFLADSGYGAGEPLAARGSRRCGVAVRAPG